MSVRVAVRVAEPWELKSIFEAHFEDRIHDLEDRIHRQVVLRMLRSTILLRMLRSTNHPLRPSHRPPGGKCLGNPPRPGRAAGRIHQLLAALGAVAASMAVGSSAGTGDRSWLRGEQLRSAQPRGLQLEPQVAASAICESPRPRPGTNYFKRSGGGTEAPPAETPRNFSGRKRCTVQRHRDISNSAATSRHQQQCCDTNAMRPLGRGRAKGVVLLLLRR